MITLHNITLDHDLDWEDEFEWSETTGAVERSLEGTLLAEVRPIIGGRPITLAGSSDRGWQTRATVLALKALVATGDVPYILTLEVGEPEERVFTVKFRHEESNPAPFSKAYPIDNPKAGTWYTGSLLLREV